MPVTPEFYWTLAIFVTATATAGLMRWLEKRPRRGLETSLLPTTPILLVAGSISLLALVHLLNLYGINTGRGQ